MISLGLTVVACSAPKVVSTSEPINHNLWDSLLQQYVDEDGLVDYTNWQKDTQRLTQYLDLLSQNAPNERTWTRDEQLAYWINAYNAFTIALVLEHYPVASIKDIKNGVPFVNSVWDIKFINIQGVAFDLNNIEHGIIRGEWDDPRIHFALVCASTSCPKLQNRAFTGNQLNEQLDMATKQFLTDPSRNEINKDKLQLSKILQWYWVDFKAHYPDRVTLVNAYQGIVVSADATVDFLDYDWSLNAQKNK